MCDFFRLILLICVLSKILAFSTELKLPTTEELKNANETILHRNKRFLTFTNGGTAKVIFIEIISKCVSILFVVCSLFQDTLDQLTYLNGKISTVFGTININMHYPQILLQSLALFQVSLVHKGEDSLIVKAMLLISNLMVPEKLLMNSWNIH